jgi:putative aldouronate transport system substrate-binding protein
MSMRLKKFLVGLVPVMLIMAGFSVFANGTGEKQETSVPPLVLATADNTYGLSTDPDLQQSITDMIKDKTGIVVSPIIPPLASYPDKLATLINSGSVPDLFVVSQAMVKIPQMVARDQIIDLTDYIKHSPFLSHLDPSLFSAPQINGKTYFVPYNYPKSKAIYLRRDVMQKYGIRLSHTPTTEEFRTEMKKLVGTDVVPFTFPKWIDNFQYFYNSFGAWGGVYLSGGKYVDGFQEPRMAKALAYLQQLYTDGILNKEFLTTENSMMREKTYTAQSASDIDYVTNYINYVQNTAAAQKPTDMFLIYKLVGPDGNGGSLNEATQTAWVVSSKTKHPKEAVRLIEAIVTDPELYPAFYGIGLKGYHYELGNNGIIVPTKKAANSGYKYTLNWVSDSFLNVNIDTLPFALDKSMIAGLKAQREYIHAAQPNLGPNHSSDVPVGISDEYDRIGPSIKSTRESIATKIVVGTVTLEQGLNEYRNFWKSIDGDRILRDLNASLKK